MKWCLTYAAFLLPAMLQGARNAWPTGQLLANQTVLQKTLGRASFKPEMLQGVSCSCRGVCPRGQLLANAGTLAESSEGPFFSLEVSKGAWCSLHRCRPTRQSWSRAYMHRTLNWPPCRRALTNQSTGTVPASGFSGRIWTWVLRQPLGTAMTTSSAGVVTWVCRLADNLIHLSHGCILTLRLPHVVA
jgi:hypothetical protein